MVATKVCQGEIYELYVNLNTRFKSNAFNVYKSLLCVKHESIVVFDDKFEHECGTFNIWCELVRHLG
jgi:hypothetical protein